MSDSGECALCNPDAVLIEGPLAYARLDDRAQSPGHALIVPRRHAADFFDLTRDEQIALVDVLSAARRLIQARHGPDGYNVGINIGRAAGQSRLHVHVHLIPRYSGDVTDPAGGIRCVLPAAGAR